MITIKVCLRCDNEFYQGRCLTPREQEAIKTCEEIKVLAIHREETICGVCEKMVGKTAAKAIIDWRNKQ